LQPREAREQQCHENWQQGRGTARYQGLARGLWTQRRLGAEGHTNPHRREHRDPASSRARHGRRRQHGNRRNQWARIKALEATDFVGVRGRVKFDAAHDLMDGPGLVNQVFVQWQRNGERAVIWPKDLATGTMINPPWMAQN
jgi:hypothetical protein